MKKKLICVVLIIIAIILILTGLFLEYKKAINSDFEYGEKKIYSTKKMMSTLMRTRKRHLLHT